MMKSLGERKEFKPPFLGKFTEINITYDYNTLGVEVDGLRHDGGWENILVEFDVDNPESYAHGIYDTIRKLFPSLSIMVSPVSLVESEGWFLEDGDAD